MTTGDLAGIGVTVVIAVVMVVLWTKERHTRGLSYSVLTNRPLLTGHGPFPVTVNVHHQTVAAPHLVVWRLVNVGAQAIDPDDYEQGITFTARDARIVSADVTCSRPSGVKPQVTAQGDAVALENRLLNGRDMIEVQMLVDGKPSGFSVNCRIKGISKVNMVKLPRTSWDQPWRYSTVDKVITTLFYAGLGGVGIYLLATAGQNVSVKVLGWALAASGILVLPTFQVRSNRRNKLFLGA
ncbi:hypothetical protein [Kribbella sp. NBC_00889]|uniref:hypothetical protein n=1 Tax=Kribbella sp. NBC_00889 TaxID=2975974 RepID=UPI00386F1F30|nr:hypothetical protein OG817_34020 [Kribbella sp. NBC_00889]